MPVLRGSWDGGAVGGRRGCIRVTTGCYGMPGEIKKRRWSVFPRKFSSFFFRFVGRSRVSRLT